MTQRQSISEADKQRILERQGLRCFIDGHPVDNADDLEFDHIDPVAEDGATELANIGAVCKKHNREKGTMSLSEYRDKLVLGRFFEGARKRRLDDLLAERLGVAGYGESIELELKENHASLFLTSGPIDTPLFVCPATRETYFFAVLPARVLKNDSELQPRPLELRRLWELYRHLRTHTQLAPAVCRLVGKSVLLFDGQHKAAAQVWAGRNSIDCKVYVEPDIRRLKETNLAAHDELRQMPFYTSTLIEKYAAMASEDWGTFLSISGAKSEAAFVGFLRARHKYSKAEAVKRVRAMIYQDIIEDRENLLRDYVAEENRARKNPLTMSRLQKTFFSEFVAPPPLQDDFETPGYYREDERENVVRLFNLIVKHSLEGAWAPERGDADHAKAERLYSAGALRAWVPFLRDAIAAGLKLFEEQERRLILYRVLSDDDFRMIEKLLVKLLSHKVWVDPNPELKDLRYDDAERAREMLRNQGLTPNWILGGHE